MVDETLGLETRSSHGPQAPSRVPLLPGLNIGKNPFGEVVGGPARQGKYQALGKNGFTRHNGDLQNRHTLTTGTWQLYARDRPYLEMKARLGSSYAQPAFLPGLGMAGTVRVGVEAKGILRWLDQFDSIDLSLYPGRICYTCSDRELGITVHLEVDPFVDRFGFAVRADVNCEEDDVVRLLWAVGNVGDGDDEILLKRTYAELSAPCFPYTRVYAGATSDDVEVALGPQAYLQIEMSGASSAPLDPSAGAVNPASDSAPPCALVSVPLDLGPGRTASHHFVCVWGYTDYDREGVEAAYRRIRFRPFPDPGWAEEMRRRYFQHWIGNGLDPERKFLELRESVQAAVEENVEFWRAQSGRLTVSTPDRYLDTVINSMSAAARLHYEYPAFIHGLEIHKYGKINHGYYGFESAGLHEEVAESLKFVAGTQCVKGRQRYFSPALAISTWAEDVDFYFVEQVWYHWRWTGDTEFLATMWPSARRALEHGLAVSDPDGNGLMAGYYEQWNCDGNDSGDRGVLQTAMAWSALRAAAQMAAVLGDVDYVGHAFRSAFHPDPPAYSERYLQRMSYVEEQFTRHLWNNDVGAWSSAEPNGIVRPRAHTMEQNYHVWRGLGDPMRNYMALRFIREQYHRNDVVPDATLEYVDDFWPVIWSHHYMASGDTLATFLSACAAGDAENHWEAFKTVSDTAYEFGGPVWHHVGCRTMETDPMYLQAVIDGLFGLKPWLGDNLLVVCPSFPGSWDRVECSHRDIRYTYRKSASSIEMMVSTPVPRKVRLELPVKAPVGEVTLDGKPVDYRIRAEVNCARVIVEIPEGTSARLAVETISDGPAVEGDVRCLAGHRASFAVRDVDGVQVHDPQASLRQVEVTMSGDRSATVTFVPVRPGSFTVFLELSSGNVRWLHPLDLTVAEPVRARMRFAPGLTEGGPAVISPRIDVARRTLNLQVENNTGESIGGDARIIIGQQAMRREVSLPARGEAELDIDLGEVWNSLSPGTVPVRLEISGFHATAEAVAWSISADAIVGRLLQLDLRQTYNADMQTLFSPSTQWRLDYAGAQHGVDWRYPLPPIDERGFVIVTSIMSLYDYGELPEHILPVAAWEPPADLSIDTGAACGIPFLTEPGKILAVCCTEPYEQFPSNVEITLKVPTKLEKIYLLTANLVKPRKSYYPAAELVVHYASGLPVIHSLVPPHTMPGLLQHFCPRACAIPYGALRTDNPVPDKRCYLSVTDLVLDADRVCRSIELRSVATETLLGVVGMTLLCAADGPSGASREVTEAIPGRG